MELSLIEQTEHTKIKVGIEKLKTFASFIHGVMDEEEENNGQAD